MDYKNARQWALALQRRLESHCERIEIAGSIRRKKKTDIKDIELVVIPKKESGIGNLFEPVADVRSRGFIKCVNSWDKIKGDPSEGKYCQRQIVEGVTLDLFIADHENFGWQYLLRTGPTEYTIKVILPALKARGINSLDGYLYRNGELIPVAREEEVFALLGTCVVPPRMRETAIFKY